VKKHSPIALVAVIVLGLLSFGGPLPRQVRKNPEALIRGAFAIVNASHFSRDEINKALVDVLDASLLILPKTPAAEKCGSRIKAVRKMMTGGEIFSDQGREDLRSAYKLISGGSAWDLPKELTAASDAKRGIEQATKICLGLLDSALAEWNNGRAEQAVIRLVSFVLLVVTPIQA
jgi:hypothetical protein